MLTFDAKKDDQYTLHPLVEGSTVIGDEVEVQLSISSKHALEYVHLRDPRGAGFERIRAALRKMGFRHPLVPRSTRQRNKLLQGSCPRSVPSSIVSEPQPKGHLRRVLL